jgi:hypothetical protein
VKTIPIHDATAPVACTATGDEIRGRIQQLERMRSVLTRLERTEHGLLLHFPDQPDIDAHLRTFAIDEKGCCAFWGFDVTTNGEELTLRWDGPAEVAGLFERLVTWFDGDEPLTAASGLL